MKDPTAFDESEPAGDHLDLDAIDDGAARGDGLARSGRRRTAATNRWMRWLHVYTSMVSLLVVLFFGVTGLTLNHPSWTFGDEVDRTTAGGTLPDPWRETDGDPDLLAISEFVRGTHDVAGDVADYGTNGGQAFISYKGPGYAADVTVNLASGEYDVVVEAQGWVGVLNDLHKGRDTSGTWKWVIDISAILLVLVSLTGLGIQLFQRKRRTRAIVFAALGGVAAVVLMVSTLA